MFVHFKTKNSKGPEDDKIPTLNIWASTRQNLSLGFPTKRDSNRSPQPQRLARKSIFFVASLDIPKCE